MNDATRLPDDVAAALRNIASADAGCGRRSGLLRLMREDAPIYQAKSASEVERLRALIAAKLAMTGLADELVPYAIEELETGTNAYAIAAAARIVRAASALPPDITELIVGAVRRVRPRNEFVQFDGDPSPSGINSLTAVDEAIEALSVMGPQGRAAIKAMGRSMPVNDVCLSNAAAGSEVRGSHAPACCGGSKEVAPDPNPIVGSVAGLHGVELQNQHGKCTKFGELFAGRPGLVAFFYTRCMNPEKCSRTVSQLGEVQRLIQARSVDDRAVIVGITYDPEYDLPERLLRYGEERGLAFGEHCQLLRSTGSFDAIRDNFQLGVGYGSSTVNRHRIELLLIDPAGAIVHSNVRRLWSAQEMADLLLAVRAD